MGVVSPDFLEKEESGGPFLPARRVASQAGSFDCWLAQDVPQMAAGKCSSGVGPDRVCLTSEKKN
jgi:hypothetical protein